MMHYGKWLDGVRYTDDLDGGGRLLAPAFEAALRGRSFKRCFEWCAGPAWIGLWLLENGIIEELVTGDINPAAVEAVRLTAKATGANVTAVVSDNMKGAEGQFDLIIGNAPSYQNIQADHPMGFLKDDVRTTDTGWKIHREFYRTVSEYLVDGGEIWLSEVEPFSAVVYLGENLYDKRDNVPIVAFLDMMRDGGLMLDKVLPFNLGPLQMGLLKAKVYHGR